MSDRLPGDKIYDDLLHPSFEAAGIIASLPIRALRAKLAPYEKWIISAEKNIPLIAESVSKNIADVDPQNIVTPEAYIAVPALQGISYCMDNDELRSLYAKLLASAMQIDKKEAVLPAFTEIIKQMSPTDALVTKNLLPEASFPLADVRYQIPSKNCFLSVSDFKWLSQGICIFENLSILLNDAYTRSEIAVSIENLSRLGLIQISNNFVEEQYYAPLSLLPCCAAWKSDLEGYKRNNDIPEVLSALKVLPPTTEFALIPKMFSITNLGKLFFKTCIS